MKKALRFIARFVGWTTSYHVAAAYQQDSHVGWSVLSLTVTARPWIHEDNYIQLLEAVKSEAERPTRMPSITSITKLGI